MKNATETQVMKKIAVRKVGTVKLTAPCDVPYNAFNF